LLTYAIVEKFDKLIAVSYARFAPETGGSSDSTNSEKTGYNQRESGTGKKFL
jgi:hypothetical protein